MLAAEAAWKPGLKGRGGRRGRARRSGPALRVKNWVEVWLARVAVPGGEGACDRVGAALGRGGEEAAFGAEEVHVEGGEAGSGEVLEGDRRAGRSAGRGDGASELDVGAEAVGDEEDAVAVAGLGFAEVDGAGQRAGQGRAVDRRGCRPWRIRGTGLLRRCRSVASASEQEVLPSAALGLIENPSGRVTVAPRSSDGEGMVGLSSWGTLEVDVDARGGVGVGGRRLRVEARVEAELVAAGHLRPGSIRPGRAAIVGEDFERRS